MIFEKHREGKETKDCWKGVACFSHSEKQVMMRRQKNKVKIFFLEREQEYCTFLRRENNMVKRRIGLWWMSWSQPAKKAVISCEKLRGGAHIL